MYDRLLSTKIREYLENLPHEYLFGHIEPIIPSVSAYSVKCCLQKNFFDTQFIGYFKKVSNK